MFASFTMEVLDGKIYMLTCYGVSPAITCSTYFILDFALSQVVIKVCQAKWLMTGSILLVHPGWNAIPSQDYLPELTS